MFSRVIRLNYKTFLFYGGLAIVLAAALLTALTVRDMQPLPDDLDQLIGAQVKAQILDRDGRPLTITYQNEWNTHAVIPLYRIPDFLQQAFILAEDKRFYQHQGIDWRARLNALWQNTIALKGVRGASTISEQAVRMIHKRPRTVWSRWLEGWEARQLEAKFDKPTILEFYLNQVPYAAQRRGVQQAADYYFDRDVQTLNEKEMLALAVLVRAPSYFDLYKSTERLSGRLNTLLDRAYEEGLVIDSDLVRDTALSVDKPKVALNAAHFARHIYGNAERHGVKRLGTQENLENQTVQSLKTTLNSEYQGVAQSLLNQRLEDLADRQVANAGMIVVDHQTDEVLVWAVAESANDEGADYDTVLVKRQPGSTLKPFVYASAMEKGWTAATIIDDKPLREGVGQGVHTYRNYSNRHYGEISLRNALGNSLNIPAIKAAQFVGVEPLIETLGKLGIKDLNLRSVDYGNGIALGNAEINLLSLVQAYAVLARQGMYRPLRTNLSEFSERGESVFSPEVSSIIGNILSDQNARSLEFGVGGTLQLPVQTAVKTGTSNDYRDAWVVGYNHRYVVGVWMGNLDNTPMDRVTGSTGPALVLRSMFAELNRSADTQALFLSRKLVQQKVCIDTGLLAINDCPSRYEWFRHKQVARNEEPRTNSTSAVPQSYQLAHPIDQMLVARDPRIPDHMEALEFKLDSEQDIARVDWYLNGEVIASTKSAKYHWPLTVGKHSVKAKVFKHSTSKSVMTKTVSMLVK